MRRAVALLTLLLLASGSNAFAVTPRASLPDIEDEVMCPVCGTPLIVAEAPQAERERVFIRQLIARGETKSQIKRKLVDEYGSSVLALPEKKGFNLVVYLVPVGAILFAALLLALALPRWRRRRTSGSLVDGDRVGASPFTPAEAKQLEEELASYDS